MNKNETKKMIQELVNKYELAKSSRSISNYSEEETKKDFISPLFQALGWDMSNKIEVSAEEANSGGRLDYGFYLDGKPKFFLEAKSLKADLQKEEFANQAVRYSWNKGVTWAILTDFESIKVFNAQDIEKSLADKLFFEIKLTEYLTRFDQLWLLSKEAFKENLIDKEAEKYGKKLQRVSITSLLYKDLDKCREILTNDLAQWNQKVDRELLDEGVQKLLDRLIFIRVAEDRGIEPSTLIPLIREWDPKGGKEHLYQSMVKKFRELDGIYNSNLFSQHPFEKWEEYSGATERVINILYGKKGYYEYDFQAMPADVLGGVYENYLGYKLEKSKKGLSVSKDAKKRKEQGIYYTPDFIVDYIVKNTLKPVLDKCKSISDIKKIKVLDPACGSGSFLIKALEVIHDKYLEFGSRGGVYTKLDILLNNIYGIDLDPQAVEIARLNLLINALDTRMKLPGLENNIKNGNSLISGTDEELEKYFGKNFRDKKTFNWEEEFPEVFKQGGFDVIIGNPPYVDSESMVKKFPEDRQFISKKYIAAKGNWDLYIPFWELAFKLLKNEGVASYITPNKWVSIKYGESLRKLLFSHLIKICNLTNIKVFAAGNSPIVVFINKGVSSKTIGIETINSDIKIQHTGNVQKVLIENDDWGLLLSTYPRLVTKLMTFGKISDFLSVENPFTVSEAYDLKKILTDGNYKKGFLKFINTGTIDRYACLWGIKSTTYLKEKYQTPVVNRKDFARLFSKRYKQISLPKIITSGMRNFDSLLDERGNMLAGKSTIIIKPKSNKESLYFFLGVLNSKLISFYIKQKYSALGIDGGINFTTELIRNLPEPNYKGIIKLQIESDVRKIIDLKSKLSNYEADSEKWSSLKSEIEKTDRKIDEEVYKLYNLTSEEIRIVEKS